MKIEEVMKYRFIVKGFSIQTVDDLLYDEDIYKIFFKKNGELRKGYVATNQL